MLVSTDPTELHKHAGQAEPMQRVRIYALVRTLQTKSCCTTHSLSSKQSSRRPLLYYKSQQIRNYPYSYIKLNFTRFYLREW